MDNSTVRSKQVLREIRRGFLIFRRNHGTKRSGYPNAIKVLAVSGLEQDCTHSEVARAAGVTVVAIRLWRKSMRKGDSIARKTRPLELKLVQSREALPIPPHDRAAVSAAPATTVAMAYIEFRSGARMTVPVSAISEQLLSLLMGGAL